MWWRRNYLEKISSCCAFASQNVVACRPYLGVVWTGNWPADLVQYAFILSMVAIGLEMRPAVPDSALREARGWRAASLGTR